MTDPFPRCTLRPLAADEGEGYLIEFPDYPGCMADGPTPEQALQEGYDALRSYRTTLRELGHPLPRAAASYARTRAPAAAQTEPALIEP